MVPNFPTLEKMETPSCSKSKAYYSSPNRNLNVSQIASCLDDDYAWLKYGQKNLAKSGLRRCYYRCSEHKAKEPCPAKCLISFRVELPNEMHVSNNHNHNHRSRNCSGLDCLKAESSKPSKVTERYAKNDLAVLASKIFGQGLKELDSNPMKSSPEDTPMTKEEEFLNESKRKWDEQFSESPNDQFSPRFPATLCQGDMNDAIDDFGQDRRVPMGFSPFEVNFDQPAFTMNSGAISEVRSVVEEEEPSYWTLADDLYSIFDSSFSPEVELPDTIQSLANVSVPLPGMEDDARPLPQEVPLEMHYNELPVESTGVFVSLPPNKEKSGCVQTPVGMFYDDEWYTE